MVPIYQRLTLILVTFDLDLMTWVKKIVHVIGLVRKCCSLPSGNEVSAIKAYMQTKKALLSMDLQ